MRRPPPLPPPKKETLPTRNEILVRADELIRRRGFNAFSYADIAQVLEIRNAAVHYHFPTKSDLGQAVIERELEGLAEYRRRNAATPGDEQLKYLVTVFYQNCQQDHICLMGSLLPDFATFDGDMQEKISEMCGAILDWVAGALENGRKKARLRFKGDAADRARLFVSALLSSLLLSRALGQSVFRQMVDRVLEDLGVDWRVGDLPLVDFPFPDSLSFTSKNVL